MPCPVSASPGTINSLPRSAKNGRMQAGSLLKSHHRLTGSWHFEHPWGFCGAFQEICHKKCGSGMKKQFTAEAELLVGLIFLSGKND
jgi:hypothetical protein